MLIEYTYIPHFAPPSPTDFVKELLVIFTCISDYRRVLDRLVKFIVPYTSTQLGTIDNMALSLLYTLYSSLIRTH
jgi:hypothetical protein